MNLSEELQHGCEQLGIALNTEAQRTLLEYVALLHKWNKVYNLTAIRDQQQMVSNHLLDSLAVLPYLWPRRPATEVSAKIYTKRLKNGFQVRAVS